VRETLGLEMSRYYRAYHRSDLEAFAEWKELITGSPDQTTAPDDPEQIWYLRDDLRAVTEPFDDAKALFNEIPSGWEEFCTHELRFDPKVWS
jgi:hypothetical protein